MSRTAEYNVTAELADAIVAHFGTSYRGRTVRRESETVVSFYGSNGDIAAFAEEAAKIKRALVGDAATEKQIAFITTLINRDPAAAMTIGASADGVRPVGGMTKAQASKFIDTLTAGV